MKLRLSIALLFSAVLTFSQAANAETITALTVTADYFPGDTFYLKLDLDADHKISKVHFVSPTDDQPFSLDDLQNGYQTLFEKFGVSVVQLHIDSMPNDYSAEIDIRYRTSVVSHSRKYYKVQYNNGHYEVLDEQTDPAKIIHNANVVTKAAIFGVPSGILNINTF